MYDTLHRHDVKLLLRAGLSRRRITEITGISARTIGRIGREAADGGPVRLELRRDGRPGKAVGLEGEIQHWLRDDPGLKPVELLHCMRQRGYEGQKSAAYALIASLRQKAARYVVRFEGLPGEFTQHDFGEVQVRFVDGRTRRIHFFATRLKYSRWVEVTVVPDQRAKTIIRALVGHLAAIGGVPLLAVFDRPKTIAVEWRRDRTVTRWNTTFRDAMFRLGLGVELCCPPRSRPVRRDCCHNCCQRLWS